jgi:hypothetical protein
VALKDKNKRIYLDRKSPALNRYEEEVDWNCQVIAGETTVHDIHVGDPLSLVLRGRIRFEGVPSSSITATLVPKGQNFFNSKGERARPDDDGNFELALEDEGDYRLVLSHSDGGVTWMILDEVHAGPDIEPWELEIDSCSLEVVGIDVDAFRQDIPPFAVRWDGPDDALLLCIFTPASDAFTLDTMPAGTLKFVIPDPTKMLEPGLWEVAREVSVAQDETGRMEAP